MRRTALVSLVVVAGACAGPRTVEPPRTLVLFSGARLGTDYERVNGIHDWVLPQIQTISTSGTAVREGTPGGYGALNYRRSLLDPTVCVAAVAGARDSYPWETLVIQGDTARVQIPSPEVRTAYMLYAHFHLLRAQGRIEERLPEAPGAEGYALERAIVQRLVDAWLLGRASFFLEAYRPMDELLFAAEAGHLDAFLFAARPDDFPDERAAWIAANPGALEAFHAWRRSTWDPVPPTAPARGWQGVAGTGECEQWERATVIRRSPPAPTRMPPRPGATTPP